MNIISQDEEDLIKKLSSMEAEVINLGFNKSEDIGKIFLKNTIQSFMDFLTKQYGEFVPAMSTHYRFFMTQLLSEIEDKHIASVVSILFKGEI